MSIQVCQIMTALDVADAVSNITRENARLLQSMGESDVIYSEHFHPEVASETRPLKTFSHEKNRAPIFHYWNYNTSLAALNGVHTRKALHYHNITPPEFFKKDTPEYDLAQQGYRQLEECAGIFDLLVGDSWYNMEQLRGYITKPTPAIALHPVIDVEVMRKQPCNENLFRILRRDERCVHFLFVGRVARNKRQDRLLRFFDYYYRKINPNAHLWLVGNNTQDPVFTSELNHWRGLAASCDAIHLVGKVSDEDLNAFFRAADVFLCASQHEGFCVPLIQAMSHDCLVMAYDAAAVPETMGDAGILLKKWDVPRIAELVNLLLADTAMKTSLLDSQRKNLSRFSRDEIKIRLSAIVEFLKTGQISPLFSTLHPKESR